jgi:glutaredoxin
MQIKDRLPYIVRVKNGSVKPTRCGACDYCRATKKLFEIKPYYRLMPEFKGAREEDYAEGTMLADPQAQSILESLPTVQQADTLEKV